MQENKTRQLHGTKELTASHIQVHIERHAWNKMYGWCKAAKGEVSGMGLVKIVGDNFIVTDAFLPKQYGSTAYTELDDISNSKLQARLIRQGRDMTQYRFWWHTHYNFDVFWSGTDDDNAKEQMKANGEWELSVVINQRGEYRARADFMTTVHPLLNFPQHYLVDELPVFLIPDSKYHRRKRNFRSDIRRWVRPMSEMPESQKPKPIIIPPSSLHDENGEFHFPGFGRKEEYVGSKEWGDGWQKKLAEPEGSKSPKDRPSGRGGWAGYKDGDPFGPYIYYQGVLISPGAWENIKKGLKLGGDMADKIKDGKSGDVIDDSKKECECQDPECWEGSRCVPCSQCGGRWQTKSGYCPGCVKLQGDANVKCPCNHEGVWDVCVCGPNCNKCLEDEYAKAGLH